MNLRNLIVAVLLLLLAVGALAKEQRGAVVVVGPSGFVHIDSATKAVLINKAKELIESSNFDSINQPNILSKPTQTEWEEVCSEPCVEVKFSEPTSFQTIGGLVTLSDVRISLLRGNVQGKNEKGLIRFGKYQGAIWIKVRNATGINLP